MMHAAIPTDGESLPKEPAVRCRCGRLTSRDENLDFAVLSVAGIGEASIEKHRHNVRNVVRDVSRSDCKPGAVPARRLGRRGLSTGRNGKHEFQACNRSRNTP